MSIVNKSHFDHDWIKDTFLATSQKDFIKDHKIQSVTNIFEYLNTFVILWSGETSAPAVGGKGQLAVGWSSSKGDVQIYLYQKMIQKNVWINICDKYLNIFITHLSGETSAPAVGGNSQLDSSRLEGREMSKYIRIEKLILTNVRINISDKYIWIYSSHSGLVRRPPPQLEATAS